ncbi:MAG: carbohydrate kinase family protein [Candidatus Saccharibacteria bacterium]|nr:carbohydrate kinase family protein [Candidatus Saccharibacteria bacterium]
MSTPKILCIGDIITDDFIELSEDHADVTEDDKGYKRISFELGAKLPYDNSVTVKAVECSPNAAVSMARLGLDARLMSWLGDDKPGQEMIEYLKGEGVSTDELVVEEGMKSNYHYVLRYGADRTKFQRYEDYSYEWKEPSVKPDWLYLGVLGEKTWPLHEEILKYLKDNPDIKLAFQPGMYHLEWGPDKLADFYKRAEVVVMNREETAQVTGKDRRDVTELIHGLHDLGTTIAVVTDGPEGAYASDGERIVFMPIYPDIKPPFDRTGAGDAFASTLTAVLASGKSLETALTWAPINSMNVSQHMGAQEGLLTERQIAEFLENAPQEYKPRKI